MGDMADAILDGDCCEMCGVFFDESGDGYPRKCGGCEDKRQERIGKLRGMKNKPVKDWGIS